MSILELKNICYTYGVGTPFEKKAVNDVSFSVNKGELIGIIGHTGSGKSTLVQMLNGLMKPTSGQVLLDGVDIWDKPKEIRKIRFKVGMVFQYPEYQLFEETVYKDISFGPFNKGLLQEEIDKEVRRAAKFTGIKDELLDKSPFDLSGGEKRRAAIAGVIAMDPDVLVLDEPTAGLDPKERIRIRNFISEIAEDKIVLISTHVVSDIEFIAKEIILLKKGQLISHDSPNKLTKELENKVFEVEIQREDLKYFQDNYRVSNLCHNDNSIIVRIVTDNPPTDFQYTTAKPTLEDLYLYIFEQGI